MAESIAISPRTLQKWIYRFERDARGIRPTETVG